jgi:hypothetical protein
LNIAAKVAGYAKPPSRTQAGERSEGAIDMKADLEYVSEESRAIEVEF